MIPHKKKTREEAWAWIEKVSRVGEKCDDVLLAKYGRVFLAWSGPPPLKRKGWWWRLTLVKMKWFFKDLFSVIFEKDL